MLVIFGRHIMIINGAISVQKQIIFMLLLSIMYAKLIIVLYRNVLTRFEVILWKRKVDFISRK